MHSCISLNSTIIPSMPLNKVLMCYMVVQRNSDLVLHRDNVEIFLNINTSRIEVTVLQQITDL